MAQDQGFFSGLGIQSPDDVSRLLDKELLSSVSANAPAENRNSAMSGALLARGLGGLLSKGMTGQDFNANNPQVIQAVKLQALQNTVAASAKEKGIDINEDPEAYTKLVAAHAWDMGLPEVGFKALTKGREMSLARRKQETDEAQASTQAEHLDILRENTTANKEIAAAHDRTNIEVAKISAAAREGSKKPTAAKYPSHQMIKDMSTIFENDPELKDFVGDLGDNIKVMGADAAAYVAKSLRDDPEADPETVKDEARSRVLSRVHTIRKSFNPFSKKEFGMDETIYYQNPEQVKKDFKAKKLSQSEAMQILQNGFGLK